MFFLFVSVLSLKKLSTIGLTFLPVSFSRKSGNVFEAIAPMPSSLRNWSHARSLPCHRSLYIFLSFSPKVTMHMPFEFSHLHNWTTFQKARTMNLNSNLSQNRTWYEATNCQTIWKQHVLDHKQNVKRPTSHR